MGDFDCSVCPPPWLRA